MHGGLFEALGDDGFASGFDDAGAYEHPLFFEVGVAHALFVFLEVADFAPGVFACVVVFGKEAACLFDERFDVSLVEFVPPSVFVAVESA